MTLPNIGRQKEVRDWLTQSRVQQAQCALHLRAESLVHRFEHWLNARHIPTGAL